MTPISGPTGVGELTQVEDSRPVKTERGDRDSGLAHTEEPEDPDGFKALKGQIDSLQAQLQGPHWMLPKGPLPIEKEIGALRAKLPPILVVGMGPAGLATAIEAARAGRSVTLFESRSDFTRIQRVKVDDNTVSYMRDLMEDPKNPPTEEQKEIFSKLEKDSKMGSGYTIQLKDLQLFFEESIRHNSSLSSKITLKKGEGTLKSIDPIHQTAEFSDDQGQKPLRFSHIVDATGGRGLLSGLERFTPERVPLVYQPRQKEHGTVNLDTPDITANIAAMRALSQEDLPAFRALGWDKNYLPDVYAFCNFKGTKHCVAGEVPPSILAIKDKIEQRDALRKWGEAILRAQYGLGKEIKITPYAEKKTSERAEAKKKLAETAFPVELTYAPEAATALPGGGVLARVGDASVSPNFHFGHGANDAIRDAQAFGRLLPQSADAPEEFDGASYESHQVTRRKELEDKMEGVSKQRELDLQAVRKANLQRNINELIGVAEFKGRGDRIKQLKSLDLSDLTRDKSVEVIGTLLDISDDLENLPGARNAVARLSDISRSNDEPPVRKPINLPEI